MTGRKRHRGLRMGVARRVRHPTNKNIQVAITTSAIKTYINKRITPDHGYIRGQEVAV